MTGSVGTAERSQDSKDAAGSKQCRHNKPLDRACDDCEMGVALSACARILVKLAMTSEVSSARLAPDVRSIPGGAWRTSPEEGQPQTLVKAQRYGDSRVPKGVDQDEAITGRERAPHKELSLHAHYQWRMAKAQQAGDATTLLELAASATRDYERLIEPRTMRRETVGESVERLLTEFHSCTDEEAAAAMTVPGQTRKSVRAWVRRQRVLAGCSPDDGTVARQSELVARVVKMAKAGAGQRLIADEVGLAQSRVSRILAGA